MSVVTKVSDSAHWNSAVYWFEVQNWQKRLIFHSFAILMTHHAHINTNIWIQLLSRNSLLYYILSLFWKKRMELR